MAAATTSTPSIQSRCGQSDPPHNAGWAQRPVSYATLLAAEAEWFSADMSAEGLPALTKDQGGPFDIVTPHVRRLSQVRLQLYLGHGPTSQGRGSKTLVRLDHQVLAIVLVAAAGAGTREHVDQATVESAVSKVVARVIGPPGDVGHGGRWFSVRGVTVEPASPLDRLRFTDAITAAGGAHVVVVRYTVVEYTDRAAWYLETDDGDQLVTEAGDPIIATGS